jgi:hypothetical protein
LKLSTKATEDERSNSYLLNKSAVNLLFDYCINYTDIRYAEIGKVFMHVNKDCVINKRETFQKMVVYCGLNI